MLSSLEINALQNSLLISLAVSFFSVLISLFLSLSLSFFRLPFKRLFSFLFLIPLLIPPYLHAFSWMHLLIFLGDVSHSVKFSSDSIGVLRSIPGIIAILTLAYFPLSFFIILQTIKNIPQQLVDSASQVTNPFQALKRIVLPLILPAVLTAALLTFIISFITFDVPAFLGKNVFITQIFKSFTFSNEVTRALYLSAIPVLIVGCLWAFLLLFLFREKPFFSFQSQQKNLTFTIELPKILQKLIFIFSMIILLLSGFLPLGILQIKNLLYEKITISAVSSFSVITDTFWISLISSVIIVLFSSIIYFFFYRKTAGRIFFLSLLALPPITYGILFIYLFNQPVFNSIYSTPVILIIAYSLRFSPLLAELLYTHARQVNPQYFESARLVYPPSWKILNKIIIPVYKPVLFLAWMFGFWLVATELPITLLVQPPGFQTIITRLFIVLHYGAEELMSLMTVSLLLISLFPILAVYLFLRIDKK